MKKQRVKLDESDAEIGRQIASHPAWAGDHGFEDAQLKAWERQRTWALNKIADILKHGPRKEERFSLAYFHALRPPKCPQRVSPTGGGTRSGKCIATASRSWIIGDMRAPSAWLEYATSMFALEHPDEGKHQAQEAGDNEPN